MKTRIILAACFTSLAPFVAGCNHESGAVAAVPNVQLSSSKVERVVCGKPQRKNLIRTSVQPARIEAFEETPIFAKLAGYVDTVHVDIGETIKKGQPLVTLRIPELQNEVDQKRALVAQAAAEIKQAEAQIAAAEATSETAAAQVTEARAKVARMAADVTRWTAEHARIKQLASGGSVTDKLVDETQSQLMSVEASREESVAAVASAEAGMRASQAMIEKAKADHVAVEARLTVTKSDLARAETMLSYTVIESPYDGIVTQRSIDTGHFVQPASGTGAKSLLEVARTDKVRVYIEVPEMEAGLVNTGDPVTLRVQALPGLELVAPVARTSWSLDAGNRALRTEVDIDNNGSSLRPGMFASATIELDNRADVLSLPIEAVVPNEGESYCCRVDSGRIVRQPIELGVRVGSEIEVVNGIEEDTLVVLVRPQSLMSDQEVQVIQSRP